MKIIYSSAYSHSGHDMFPLSNPEVAINEYTYTHIFNGLEHRYDFKSYFSGHNLYRWNDDKNIALIDNNISIRRGISKNAHMFIDEKFDLVTYYGKKEIYKVDGVVFFKNFLLIEYPNGVDDDIHLELYENLDDEPLYTLKGKYQGYRQIFSCGNDILITSYSGNNISIQFYNAKLQYVTEVNLETKSEATVGVISIKEDTIYILSHPFDIFCVSLETKKIVWHTVMPWPFNIDWGQDGVGKTGLTRNHRDKQYCIQARDEGRWALVDLDTGKITQDVNIKLSEGVYFPPQGPGCLTYGYRSFYCEGFVFVEFSMDLLIIYEAKTGKKLHEIAIPNEFSFLSFMGFKSDCFYFYLIHSASAVYIPYSGILIIPREELLSQEPLKLELEDKGDIHHNIIPDGEFESYEVVASYDNMGDALRFIQIEMNTIVCLHSYTHYSQGTSLWKLYVNQKFNGKVTIKIDRDKLKDRDDRKFDQMVSLYNEYYQEISFAPIGAKLKRPVHAQVTWEYF